MSHRINLLQNEPKAFKAIMELENYVGASSLSPILKELIKIRASQINGCAYCINMHTKDARKYGETEQRIYLVSAWREADYFTEEEKAVLALTEEITLITSHVSDATYQNVAQFYSEKEIAEIIMSIVTINAWNRIAISTGMRAS